jgi:hypothetical protein
VNYGHPVTFGISLTPSAEHPVDVVESAQRAESLGFDLITVGDSPNPDAPLDGWTMLSWIAGSTERIALLGQFSAPSRFPAVTARAAASLDLLSAGRLTLCFGGDRDAIASVEETIDISRNMWATGEPGSVRYSGDVYRVDGAQRGPAPAHDVPIVIRGSTPDLVRLAGEKADGWLSDLDGTTLKHFRAANGLLDERATAVGRDPREIRRMVSIRGEFLEEQIGFLEGSSADWLGDLLPLIIEDGVSTILLESANAATLRKFAQEIIPALRAAVAIRLPSGTTTSRVRRSSEIAKRRPGIRYDSLPAVLTDAAIEPGDFEFPRVRSTYMRGGAPGLVLRVRTTAEVAAGLGFARQHRGVPFSIRSGGHGISGRSTNDGGIVLNVSELNHITVLDVPSRRVSIGPGARWMDVAAALHPYGWALTSGDYGGVGVGGLATAGGVGFLGREHGLTIDHLRAVEMVLADGSLVRASDSENADLFWAVRGAGANFGVVTSFEFEVDEVGDVGWAELGLDASDTAGFLRKWGETSENAPRDTTSFLIMGPPQPGQPAVAQIMAMVDASEPQTIVDRLQPFADISALYSQSVQLMPYASVMANAQGESNGGQGEPVSRTGLLDHITPEFANAASGLIRSGVVYFFQIRAVGGAIADVDPDATAYAHRTANFSVVAFGSNRRRLDEAWDALHPFFDGIYLSFETDPRPERLLDAFPPRTLARLQELKVRFDPDNLFNDNFPIHNSPTDDTTLAEVTP